MKTLYFLLTIISVLYANIHHEYYDIRHQNLPNCTQFTTCGSCAMWYGHCGWCALDRTCYDGTAMNCSSSSNSSSPASSSTSTSSSSANGWVSNALECPINANESLCTQFTNCTSCSSMDQCGWCASSSTCYVGNSLGASSPKTCSGSWLWAKSECPTELEEESCDKFSTCSDCSRRLNCGWCATTSSCTFGISLGPTEDNVTCANQSWVWYWPYCYALPSKSHDTSSNSTSSNSTSNSTSSNSTSSPSPSGSLFLNHDNQVAYNTCARLGSEEIVNNLDITFTNTTSNTTNITIINITYAYNKNNQFYFEVSMNATTQLEDQALLELSELLAQYLSNTTEIPRNHWRSEYRREHNQRSWKRYFLGGTAETYSLTATLNTSSSSGIPLSSFFVLIVVCLISLLQ